MRTTNKNLDFSVGGAYEPTAENFPSLSFFIKEWVIGATTMVDSVRGLVWTPTSLTITDTSKADVLAINPSNPQNIPTSGTIPQVGSNTFLMIIRASMTTVSSLMVVSDYTNTSDRILNLNTSSKIAGGGSEIVGTTTTGKLSDVLLYMWLDRSSATAGIRRGSVSSAGVLTDLAGEGDGTSVGNISNENKLVLSGFFDVKTIGLFSFNAVPDDWKDALLWMQYYPDKVWPHWKGVL